MTSLGKKLTSKLNRTKGHGRSRICRLQPHALKRLEGLKPKRRFLFFS